MIAVMAFAEPLYDHDPSPGFGNDSPTFGSLASMTPRKLNKKPVLVVDPEELAREREHLHLVGAQMVGEEDADPAPAERSASPLRLAAAMPDDEDYLEYDEQDLPPIGDSFTGHDALLGLSGREEAAEDDAGQPAKRVGLDLDALRSAAASDEDEEEDGFAADPVDFAAYDSPEPSEEPARGIGLDLDALREASGFEQEEDADEDALSADGPDLSPFDAAVPTELPEKRIGLDLDALRKAGGYDEDEEDGDFPINMPDFSALRSPAPTEEPDQRAPEDADEEAEGWSDFDEEPVDFASIQPAAPLPFDPPREPEAEAADEAEADPSPQEAPEPEPEPEPAADVRSWAEPQPELDAEPEYARELEPEPEPEAEPQSLAEPPAAPEPALLRVNNWWSELEIGATASQNSDQGAEFVAAPARPTDEIHEESYDPADFSEPAVASEHPTETVHDTEPPRPAHCQVRARLLRSEAQGVHKAKGLRGWLRRLRLWLEGY